MSDRVFQKVFISYRRQDAAAYAGRLSDNLRQELGEGVVFMDRTGIRPGAKFDEVLEQSLANCEIVIVVIGPDWESAVDDEGNRRLDDPDDWVRAEVAAALDRDIPVIPALVGDASMPRQLPEALAGLRRRNAIRLDDDDWNSDVRRLVLSMREDLGEPAAAGAAASTGESGPGPGAEASGWMGGVPRWLKVTGAVVAAVGGVLAAAKTGIEIFDYLERREKEKNPAITESHVAKATVVPAAELPFGLIHSMTRDPAAEPVPYWLYYKIHNTSGSPITIQVRGDIVAGRPFDPVELDDLAASILEPGEEREFFVNPNVGGHINRSDFDQPQPVSLRWEIVDERELPLIERQTYTIRFLPRNTMAWDLKLPDGREIPRSYMLASLAAWVYPTDPVRERAPGILRRAMDSDSDQIVEPWIEACVAELFGAGGLRVRPKPGGLFPPDDRITIQTPAEILESGSLIDPLEAVLLIAALGQAEKALKDRVHFVLFASSAGGEVIDKFLLGWTTDHRSWSAIDAGRVNDLDFETNRTQATAEVQALLASSALAEALAERGGGVYLDEARAVVAVDFEGARKAHGIFSLPE